MKKTASLILILALLAGLLCGCGAGSVGDEDFYQAGKKSPPGALDVYGGEDIGFSFLYPYGMDVTWNEEDGACISNAAGQIPYVLVNKTEKKDMTPEKYFKACDKQILKLFDSVQSTPIHQVPLKDRTLYMTRYQCTTGNAQVYIERYIDIYPDFYIQYVAVTNTVGEMNTPLYYAATTLSPEPGCYVGEYSENFVSHSQEDTGLSIQLPEMLVCRELTIGYLATGSDSLLLAVKCTEDNNGNQIYNRQNFMDRAAADPDFVAGYLGADSTTFSAGEKKTINGREFYAYPMVMHTADESFSGEIFLANADETGCIVLCYAVKDGSPRYAALNQLCLKAVNSLEY